MVLIATVRMFRKLKIIKIGNHNSFVLTINDVKAFFIISRAANGLRMFE